MPYPDSAVIWKWNTANMLVKGKKKKGSLNVKNSSNTNLGRHNDWLVLEDTYTNLTICIHFYWAEHGSKNLRSFAVQVEQEKPPDIITP